MTNMEIVIRRTFRYLIKLVIRMILEIKRKEFLKNPIL